MRVHRRNDVEGSDAIRAATAGDVVEERVVGLPGEAEHVGGVRGEEDAAVAFAGAGADVAVTDLIVKAENWDLESTAEEIRKLGRR